MRIARVIMSLALLLAGTCLAQDKPKQSGFDVAACEPDGGYYGVHFKQDGKDFILDAIMSEPGVIKAPTSLVKYVFEKTESGIDFYTFQAGKDKLEMRFRVSVGRGLYLQNGQPAALLFVREDPDGSKLATFAADNVTACQDIMSPTQEAPDTKKI